MTSAPGPSAPSTTQPASFNTLGPGPLWNGTAGSGYAGAPPQDPARSTAKPTLHWWQSSQIRGVGPTLIGVMADAKGGVSHVDFYVEGNVQANVTQTYYTDTDVNGISRTRPFWGINIDCTAASAAHPTGAIRVYAKAYANDNTMQARVIGPLMIYPRTVAYDWDKTVAASGADYTTLAAAMQAMKDALKTGGKECGRITITQTGTYDVGSPDVYDFPWSYGMSCLTHAPGVTATLVRGTGAFDPTRGGFPNGTWDPADPWAMYTYVDNIEFRGAGIVIDRKNFGYICTSNSNRLNPLNLSPTDGSQNGSGNYLFNGCKITNSGGAWPQTYWLGGPAPSLQISNKNGDARNLFAQSCTLEYQFQGMMAFDTSPEQVGHLFNNIHANCGTTYMEPRFIFGDYLTDNPKSREDYYNDTVKNGMSIIYSGVNATQASARVVYDGGSQLQLQAPAGTTIATLQVLDPMNGYLPRVTNGSYFLTFSDLVNWINARNGAGGSCQGFQATLIDDTISARQMANIGSFSQDVKGVSYTMKAHYGMHTEWVVWHNTPMENALIWNATCFNAGWSTCWVNWGGGAGHYKDISFKNNTFDKGPSGHNTGNGGSTFGSHACMENVTMTDVLQPGQGFGTDSYSRICQVVAIQCMPWNAGASWTDNVPTNCVVAGDNIGPGAGMVNLNSGGPISDAAWAALFVNSAGENWTPASGKALAAHLFATVNPRASEMALRASSDAAGAWKVGGNAPTWAF